MDIAVLGAGAIGSTFAHRLARSGHDVTVIARGTRLAQLERDGAIVLASGERTPVAVHARLDEAKAYDLVLVTVLATQVDAVLDALTRSAARAVMFMFNTFDPIVPLERAVGASRFVFGFPGGVFALLLDGVLDPQIRRGTTVSDPGWARVFSDAGIPSVVEKDMHGWLRSHAALVAPLMSMSTVAVQRGSITFAEARRYARAMKEGFVLVRRLGHRLLPWSVALVGAFPREVIASLLWLASRTKVLHDLGRLGTTEPRMLIDTMSRLAPAETRALVAIRP
ncbi:MAG: ketopantoate reductase family protein [Deltaproteobacteria bacterium]|nr:ketopantoate reductase family protein [Deltaproteobacteria bacterium]